MNGGSSAAGRACPRGGAGIVATARQPGDSELLEPAREARAEFRGGLDIGDRAALELADITLGEPEGGGGGGLAQAERAPARLDQRAELRPGRSATPARARAGRRPARASGRAAPTGNRRRPAAAGRSAGSPRASARPSRAARASPRPSRAYCQRRDHAVALRGCRAPCSSRSRVRDGEARVDRPPARRRAGSPTR